MKKYIVGVILSIGIVISPAFTQAEGLTSVQVQAILSLLSSFGADSATIANINAALTGVAPATTGQAFCHNFNKDLTIGSRGDDVSALNQALSASGIDTTGNTAEFDEDNAGDVSAFQAKYGIRQTGYAGSKTRAKLNSLYGCRNNQQPTIPAQATQPQTPAPVQTSTALTATSATITSSLTAPAGASFTVSGTASPVGSTIYLVFGNNASYSAGARVESNGTWSIFFGAGLPAGSYSVTVRAYSSSTGTGVGPVLVTGTFIATAPTTSAPLVTITYPIGGEAWTIGNTYTIRWSGYYGADINTYYLYYVRRGGSNPVYGFIARIPNINSGSYQWTIPSSASGFVGPSMQIVISTQPENYLSPLPVTDASSGYFTLISSETTLSPTISAPTIISLGQDVSLLPGVIIRNISVYGSNFDQNSIIVLDDNSGSIITPTRYSATSLNFALPTNISVGSHTIKVRGKTPGSPLSNSFPITVDNIPTQQPSVDLKVNGSDGPITLVPFSSEVISWAASPVSNIMRCISTGAASWSSMNDIGSVGSFTTSSSASHTSSITCYDIFGQSASDSVIVNITQPKTTAPVIDSMTPSITQNGIITITGSNFSATENYVQIGSNRQFGPVASQNGTLITLNPSTMGATLLSPGTYTVNVIKNPGYYISNPVSLIVTATVTSPVGDLVVQDLTWTPSSPTVSSVDPYIYFTFTIKNNGAGSVVLPSGTKFVLTKNGVTYGGSEIGTPLTLAQGGTKTIAFSSMQSPNLRVEAGTFTLTLAADSTSVVPEINEENNTISKTIIIAP